MIKKIVVYYDDHEKVINTNILKKNEVIEIANEDDKWQLYEVVKVEI